MRKGIAALVLASLFVPRNTYGDETFYTFSAGKLYANDYGNGFLDSERLSGVSLMTDKGGDWKFKMGFYFTDLEQVEEDKEFFSAKDDPIIGTTDVGKKEFDFTSRKRKREFVMPINVNYSWRNKELGKVLDYHFNWTIDLQVGLALELLQEAVRFRFSDKSTTGDIENPIHDLDIEGRYFLGIENALQVGRLRISNPIHFDLNGYRTTLELGFRI